VIKIKKGVTKVATPFQAVSIFKDQATAMPNSCLILFNAEPDFTQDIWASL
jgi:hypothetical protein